MPVTVVLVISAGVVKKIGLIVSAIVTVDEHVDTFPDKSVMVKIMVLAPRSEQLKLY